MLAKFTPSWLSLTEFPPNASLPGLAIFTTGSAILTPGKVLYSWILSTQWPLWPQHPPLHPSFMGTQGPSVPLPQDSTTSTHPTQRKEMEMMGQCKGEVGTPAGTAGSKLEYKRRAWGSGKSGSESSSISMFNSMYCVTLGK